jgi:hypothetical protein
MKQNLGNSLTSFGFKQAFSYLGAIPKKNMPTDKMGRKFDGRVIIHKKFMGVKYSLLTRITTGIYFGKNFWNLDAGVRKKHLKIFL